MHLSSPDDSIAVQSSSSYIFKILVQETLPPTNSLLLLFNNLNEYFSLTIIKQTKSNLNIFYSQKMYFSFLKLKKINAENSQLKQKSRDKQIGLCSIDIFATTKRGTRIIPLCRNTKPTKVPCNLFSLKKCLSLFSTSKRNHLMCLCLPVVNPTHGKPTWVVNFIA